MLECAELSFAEKYNMFQDSIWAALAARAVVSSPAPKLNNFMFPEAIARTFYVVPFAGVILE